MVCSKVLALAPSNTIPPSTAAIDPIAATGLDPSKPSTINSSNAAPAMIAALDTNINFRHRAETSASSSSSASIREISLIEPSWSVRSKFVSIAANVLLAPARLPGFRVPLAYGRMGVQTLEALGMGFYCKVTLIACFLGLAAPACAQVRVITGDIEHFYGPGGQVLDDAELRARNERVERSRQSKEARPRSPQTLPSPP